MEVEREGELAEREGQIEEEIDLQKESAGKIEEVEEQGLKEEMEEEIRCNKRFSWTIFKSSWELIWNNLHKPMISFWSLISK